MTLLTPRVLDPAPVASLDDWVRSGGGRALEAAVAVGAEAVIETIEASGLRGRGGAGFPTGTKWRTVASNHSPSLPSTVVVNGAEGEPGSFKDRMILLRNPYRVIEGALIAAMAVGADRVIIAVKATFEAGVDRLRVAMDEVREAGWIDDSIELVVFEGPSAYLFGEETALLEVLDGREPFPRVAPPFRHGVDEVGADTSEAAKTVMAGPDATTAAPPTLVNNVETMANIPGIVIEGPDWFRSVGTAQSPGTIVCTITGRTLRHGVAEVAMGTPLSQAIEEIGGGPAEGAITAVMSGVSNPLLPIEGLGTPLTYEDMQQAGTGLGAGGFIVFDETTDLVAVAQGASRFLAVESCGQCTPCKQDGLAIAETLERLRRSEARSSDIDEVSGLVTTVADGARCFLATQQQLLVDSVLTLFPVLVARHADASIDGADAVLIAPILDIVDGRAILDERHLMKQPDWTYGDTWSGKTPADLIDERAGGAG